MWTNQSAKKEIEELINSIQIVADKGRSSAQFIEWHLRIETLLREAFPDSPRLLQMFNNFPFSKTGGMLVQGWDLNAAIDRQHRNAFIGDINKTVGILEMALKELKRKPIIEKTPQTNQSIMKSETTKNNVENTKKYIPNNENITILFLSSSPDDVIKLRVDKEVRKIEEGFEASKLRERIKLTKKEAVKQETITKAMLDIDPDFVHFSGHGEKDGILIENENGTSELFPKEGLDKLFNLFKDNTKCIFLNACYSEAQAKTISKNSIYVIGMNDSIDDDVAIKFSIGFYQAIGAGKDIEFAFQMGLVLISQFASGKDTPVLWFNGEVAS